MGTLALQDGGVGKTWTGNFHLALFHGDVCASLAQPDTEEGACICNTHPGGENDEVTCGIVMQIAQDLAFPQVDPDCLPIAPDGYPRVGVEREIRSVG